MFPHPFVVLDLETSGIDPRKDDIIEVALIRYEHGKEALRYQALIRRAQKLPDMITVITGITDDLLNQEGQERTAVLARVQELLSGAYLVGHNIEFDHGFLNRHQVATGLLGLLDTIPFTQILFPLFASYSLESLKEEFGIDGGVSHRAMADAEATLELFTRLWHELMRLDRGLLAQLAAFESRSDWKGSLVFAEALRVQSAMATGAQRAVVAPVVGATPSAFGPPQSSALSAATSLEKTLASKPESRPLQPLSMEEIFGTLDESPKKSSLPAAAPGRENLLKTVMPQHEARPQQLAMAQAVSRAFGGGYRLILEAPTGVGKSLAYLTAAAEVAIREGVKVVLSTSTIPLQQQLFEKDVPLLNALYRERFGEGGLSVALLKGRSHYLCRRRFADFTARPRLSIQEMILLLKLTAFLVRFPDHDAGDVHLTREEELIWDFELSAREESCTLQKCRAFGPCDLARAKARAKDADLVIVNHALLCADLKTPGLLPDYAYLVVDEAHHFEETATHAFGHEIKQAHFSIPLKAIQSHLSPLPTPSDSVAATLPALLTDAQAHVERFFDLLVLFVSRSVPQSAFVEHLLVDSLLLEQQEWINVGESFDAFRTVLTEALLAVERYLEQLAGLSDFSRYEAVAEELNQEIHALQEPLALLGRFFHEGLISDLVRWMTSDTQGFVTLRAVPALIGPVLKQKLYDAKRSVVFTSATLGVKLTDPRTGEESAEPFAYFKAMMGLDDQAEELMLESPFDFEAQAYVITPDDLLPVVAHNSPAQVAGFFTDFLQAVKGGVLGLFTSHGALQQVYLAVSKSPVAGITRLFAQRLSGGRGKILKAYLADPEHSALLGVNSFWEGVDLQGSALTSLVIHKLPFDVPSEPLVKVRSQLFANGFMEYSVPRAILRFRQGFGRLIRSKTDYGVMVILDNRVLQKDYGRMFLQALPRGVMIEKMPLRLVPEKAKQWLELMKENSGG